MLQEYFKSRECDYWREFSPSYGLLDVYNRVVVIVGADCGSTHIYFLLRGARYVIGYEKEEKLRKMWKEVCTNFSLCEHGEIRGEWRGEYPDADVFVMDCEGCESSLDFSQLKKYKQCCIAVHDWVKNRIEILRNLYGFTFTYVSDDGREIMLCRIS
jgi:hypothetical protein